MNNGDDTIPATTEIVVVAARSATPRWKSTTIAAGFSTLRRTGATNSIGGVTGAFLQCWRQQAWPRICSASSDVVVQQMEIDRTTTIKLPLMIFLTSAMLGQCARLAVTVRIRSCGGFYAPTALNAIGITTKSCTASKTPCAITPGIRFLVR